MNVDLYNAFNSDAILQEVQNYGVAWRNATSVIQPRFVKFGARWDFLIWKDLSIASLRQPLLVAPRGCAPGVWHELVLCPPVGDGSLAPLRVGQHDRGGFFRGRRSAVQSPS